MATTSAKVLPQKRTRVEEVIYNLPPAERVRRVAARLQRRVYHRLCQAGYSNLGVDFFDENHMARDLSLSVADFRRVFGTSEKDMGTGWKLPTCPTVEQIEKSAGAIEKIEAAQYERWKKWKAEIQSYT